MQPLLADPLRASVPISYRILWQHVSTLKMVCWLGFVKMAENLWCAVHCLCVCLIVVGCVACKTNYFKNFTGCDSCLPCSMCVWTSLAVLSVPFITCLSYASVGHIFTNAVFALQHWLILAIFFLLKKYNSNISPTDCKLIMSLISWVLLVLEECQC